MKALSIEVFRGVGAIGVTYHTCPYWKRKDGRASIQLSLWRTKFIISLPFVHCEKIGRGSGVDVYGFFWWPKVNIKPNLYWK